MGVARSSDPTDLREDVKFTELVAAMLSSLRQMRLFFGRVRRWPHGPSPREGAAQCPAGAGHNLLARLPI